VKYGVRERVAGKPVEVKGIHGPTDERILRFTERPTAPSSRQAGPAMPGSGAPPHAAARPSPDGEPMASCRH
jgi:hypothetical protein